MLLLPHVTCPHVAHGCGGCPAIERDYDVQLKGKTEAVRHDALPYTSLGLEVRDTESATANVAYRTRAKLMVSDARVGLYKDGTHELVDIPECRVLSPVLARAAAAVRDTLTRHKTFASHVRAVDLREARSTETTLLVTWVVARGTVRDEVVTSANAALVRALADLGGRASIAVSERDETSVQALGDAPRALRGAALAQDRYAADLPWTYASHGSFVQAHRGVAARIVQRIATSVDALGKELGRAPQVLDLFAGAGPIALALAARGATVHLVESYAPAVHGALEAARAQSLAVTGEVATAEAALSIAMREKGPRRWDAVVVNPPRRGVGHDVRTGLAALAPRRILYVSCNHATLLRDLDHLALLGYRVASALEPHDMIPLTDHVEVLAELVPSTPRLLTRLAEGKDTCVVDMPPHGALRGELAAYGRVLRGAEDATGCTLLARDPDAATGDLHTTWTALVAGVTHRKGHVRGRGKDRAPLATYRRVSVVRGASLLEITTSTRRIDVVRRSLATLGHPVVGDARFGDPKTNRFYAERHGLDTPFLHASTLRYAPREHEWETTAPLAPLFQSLFQN